MSNPREVFRRNFEETRKAKDAGGYYEQPDTSQWSPTGQEWGAFSLWGPEGPYANFSFPSLICHGCFATPEAAEAHLTRVESEQVQLQFTQGVVMRTGTAFTFPCRPQGDTRRIYKKENDRLQSNWDRYQDHRRREAEELLARVRLAQRHHQVTNLGTAGDSAPVPQPGADAVPLSEADRGTAPVEAGPSESEKGKEHV